MNRPQHNDEKPTILVAGVGNIFLSDDGFGPEVVRHLAGESQPLPSQARLVDYGIRGMHLAYDLLEGYAALVLIDARPGSGAAGDLVVLEIGPDDVAGGEFDAHGMDPVAVLATLARHRWAAPTDLSGGLPTGRAWRRNRPDPCCTKLGTSGRGCRTPTCQSADR